MSARLLVFGTPNLDAVADLRTITHCRALGRAIASDDHFVLLTGGMRGSGSGSVEFHVADAVLQALPADQVHVRIETLLHCPAVVDTFRVGRVETVLAETPSERRHQLVQRADIVITLGGGLGTRELIEIALESGCPVLPVGVSGGASHEVWHDAVWQKRLFDVLHMLGSRLIAALSTEELGAEQLLAMCHNVSRRGAAI